MDPRLLIQNIVENFVLVCNKIDKDLHTATPEQSDILMTRYKSIQNQMVDLLDDMDKFIDDHDHNKIISNKSI